MNVARTLILFSLILSLFNPEKVNAADNQPDTLRILFVGNSLSYSHQLPKVLEQVAAGYGLAVATYCQCEPNYALIDHLEAGVVQRLLAQKEWDYVVVQQGPSSQPEGFRMLRDDGARMRQLAEAAGAQLVYYGVWPSRQYIQRFDAVVEHYARAADENAASYWPVGAAWQRYFARYEDYSLYGPDQFHPSRAGVFLAVLVMVQELSGPALALKKLDRQIYLPYVDRQQFLRMVAVLSSR